MDPMVAKNNQPIPSVEQIQVSPSPRKRNTPPLYPFLFFGLLHKNEGRLGEGSQGYVDLWSSRSDPKFCFAVKTLAVNLPDDLPNNNEVAILKDLPRHENVIELYQVFHNYDDGHLKIVLELVPGGDLASFRRSYVQEKGPDNFHFTEDFMWNLYYQLSSALAFLHCGCGAPSQTNTDNWKTILHRDIKSKNILVDTRGLQSWDSDFSNIRVKLCDFGLSCFYDAENLEMDPRLGSPRTWPPEMTWKVRQYGPQADVWGIGAIIQEMADGSPPIEDPEDVWGREEHLESLEGFDIWSSWDRQVIARRHPRRIDVNLQYGGFAYSIALNDFMMLALRYRKEDRPTACALKGWIGARMQDRE